MKRRTFLASSTVVLASLTLPACEYLTPLEYDPIIAEPRELSFIWDTENILKIGEMYLKQFPKEASERNLVNLILSNITLDKNALKNSTLQKIEQDYASGSIVMIDGWLLSVTEARQCALLSLINPK